MFDRFFDCLNVRSYSEGIRHLKPDLLPFRTPKDTRLEVASYYSTIVLLSITTLCAVVGEDLFGLFVRVGSICERTTWFY